MMVVLCLISTICSILGTQSAIEVCELQTLVRAASTVESRYRTSPKFGKLLVAFGTRQNKPPSATAVCSLFGFALNRRADNSLEFVPDVREQKRRKSELIRSIAEELTIRAKRLKSDEDLVADYERRLLIAMNRIGSGGYSPDQASIEYHLSFSNLILDKLLIDLGANRLATLSPNGFSCFSTSPSGYQQPFPATPKPIIEWANSIVAKLRNRVGGKIAESLLRTKLFWLLKDDSVSELNALLWRRADRIGIKLELFDKLGALLSMDYGVLEIQSPISTFTFQPESRDVSDNLMELSQLASGKKVANPRELLKSVRAANPFRFWLEAAILAPFLGLIDKLFPEWYFVVTDRSIEIAAKMLISTKKVDESNLKQWLELSGITPRLEQNGDHQFVLFRPLATLEDLVDSEADHAELGKFLDTAMDGKNTETSFLEAIAFQPIATSTYFGKSIVHTYVTLTNAIDKSICVPHIYQASLLSWGALGQACKSSTGVIRTSPASMTPSLHAWLASGSGPKTIADGCSAFESAGARTDLARLEADVEIAISRRKERVIRWESGADFLNDFSNIGIKPVDILSHFMDRYGYERETALQFLESIELELGIRRYIGIDIRKSKKWERSASAPMHFESQMKVHGISNLPADVRQEILGG